MENEELVTEGIDLLLGLSGQDMDDFTQQVIDTGKEGGEAAAYKLIQEKILTLEDDSKKEARRQKQEYEAAEKERREQEAKKAAEAAKRAVFTDEENLKLTQALKKFPGGTINRWEKISQHVGTRTPKEVLAGTKELQLLVVFFSLFCLAFVFVFKWLLIRQWPFFVSIDIPRFFINASADW